MKPSRNEPPTWESTLKEHILYGMGTLLAAAGPVLAGMDMIDWMSIFMGLNAAILIGLCLFGIWGGLGSNRSRPRHRR